jgi:hypothetical protein
MHSRNPFRAGLRLVFWALALAAFCGASFLGIAAVLAVLLETDNPYLAALCASIAWVFVSVFLLGMETVYLPIAHAGSFLETARRVLEEMGYQVAGHSRNSVATRHSCHLVFFGWGIRIECDERQARVAGPKIYVEALRRLLRVQSVLDVPTGDGLRSGGGALLKRVEIQMRVSHDKLEKLSRHVLQVLAGEAEVVCEVLVLAQSDAGIRESVVELQVRPWLAAQGITADIHKDIAKMPDANATMILPGNRRRKAAAR